MTERSFGFIAQEAELTFYNRKAIINLPFWFVYEDCDGAEHEFSFGGFVSAYLRVYNDRSEGLLKDFSLSRSSNILTLNASISDMTFGDEGYYYYELGYNMNGYDVPLRYGKFIVV